MFYTSSGVQFCTENRTAEHINNINSKPNNRKILIKTLILYLESILSFISAACARLKKCSLYCLPWNDWPASFENYNIHDLLFPSSHKKYIPPHTPPVPSF